MKQMSVNDQWGPEYVVQVSKPEINLVGFLVIDNTALGPGKGGIRMTPNVTEEEVRRLARTMTCKNALGGYNPKRMFDTVQRKIVASTTKVLKESLRTKK